MEADIKKHFPAATVQLISGSGGIYDIKLDGQLIFSRHKSGRFPTNQEILQFLQESK
ncbi:MAG: SelT/SelW/SelH family protein [Desulfobulbaceae bacterium]|nr:MAG: SelT/SelW/SelH family protein [Desulfobulbaceae bacterium]